ncbi:MAG: hypothetical protein ACTSXQ_03645 [Alphaproteobacteria bacterium]
MLQDYRAYEERKISQVTDIAVFSKGGECVFYLYHAHVLRAGDSPHQIKITKKNGITLVFDGILHEKNTEEDKKTGNRFVHSLSEAHETLHVYNAAQEMDIVIDFTHKLCLLFKYRTEKKVTEDEMGVMRSRARDSFSIYQLESAEYMGFSVNYKGVVESIKRETLPSIKSVEALIQTLKEKYAS